MSTEEFSNQFDILLTSYLRFKKFDPKENLDSIDINEYEKSIYLTDAQNELLIELYTGRNAHGSSYEQTEEMRRYLADLNKTVTIGTITPVTNGLSPNSVGCVIEDKVLFITQEQCQISSEDVCINNKFIDTLPIRRDEYNTLKDNPFKNNKVWRVDGSTNTIELISKHTIIAYKVSYLVKPPPIILEDISPLTIEGVSEVTESVFHKILHKNILEKAVQKVLIDLSKFSRQNN